MTPDMPEGVPFSDNMYLLTVEADKGDIDVELTTWTRARYPQEEEITMNQSPKTRILSLQKCDM